MHSRRVVFAFVASLTVVAACATGGSPLGGGGSVGSGDDGGSSPFQNYGDGGGTGDQDATFVPKDSGTKTPIDGGGPPPVDSGPPPTNNCTGTKSSHSIPNTGGDKYYDDWCDFLSFEGVEFDCTNNSDCSGNYTSTYEPECCYKPDPTGFCEGDFGGKSQCVPK